MSQEIRKLERDVSSKLLERGKIRFRLTEEGEALRKYADEIVNLNDGLNKRLAEMRRAAADSVRIATTPYIGLYIIPSSLQQFRTWHPELNVTVQHLQTKLVLEAVSNDEADYGLVAEQIKDARFKAIHIRDERLTLICNPKHELVGKESPSLKNFNGQTFLSFEQGYPNSWYLGKLLRRHSLKQWRIKEFDDVEPLITAVKMGDGVALVPKVTVQPDIANGKLVALKIDNKELFHPLFAVHRRLTVCSMNLTELMKFLKNKWQEGFST